MSDIREQLSGVRTLYSTNDAMAPGNRDKPATLNPFGCAVSIGAGDDGNYCVWAGNLIRGEQALAVIDRAELMKLYEALRGELFQ